MSVHPYVDAILSTVYYACILIFAGGRYAVEYVTVDDAQLSSRGYGDGSNTRDYVYHSRHYAQDNNHTRNTHWILGSYRCNVPKTGIQGMWHNR